ncbi:hypothetical protein AVEN_41974-1, partial [Araneus ventricosus]
MTFQHGKHRRHWSCSRIEINISKNRIDSNSSTDPTKKTNRCLEAIRKSLSAGSCLHRLRRERTSGTHDAIECHAYLVFVILQNFPPF